MSDLSVLDTRPEPGPPREYHFPAFERSTLANGLTVIRADVPGRPLLQVQLMIRGDAGGGATTEDAAAAGVTRLAAKAMTEGTQAYDAIELIEASERIGAELGADSGWDSLTTHVEVPRRRLEAALELLAEVSLRPTFPEAEVERLREERLNDIRQATADARRRVERAFPATVYDEAVPYSRPMAGSDVSVATLDRDVVASRHADLTHPSAATLIVSGDLGGIDIEGLVEGAFGAWSDGRAVEDVAPTPATPHADGRRVVIVDRPGAPQSEIRVGHVGVPRKTADYHALSVMNALLGGLFTSRLNRLLREEKGYTYGVHSGFDMRRAAGPFAVRGAFESDTTAPAVADILAELERVRSAPPEAEELDMAKDFLVGVFPAALRDLGPGGGCPRRGGRSRVA